MVNNLLNDLLESLRALRKPNGLYLASIGEHYKKVWVRDCFYEALPELEENSDYYRETYQSLLDFYIDIQEKHKKFYHLIAAPEGKQGFEFPHPRMTVDKKEIPEPWGFKQLDVFGELLYGIYLGEAAGIKIIRDDKDRWIIKLIIEFLEAIKYWECADNAIWEENEEIHCSSVGACIAGLTAIRLLDFEVKQWVIDKGYETLNRLLPKESETKEVDLALLTLIYPFNIVDIPMARRIIANVESELLRDRGVIRYKDDKYYMRNDKEMEWCFGIAFLSLASGIIGDHDKARYYVDILKEKCILKDFNKNGIIVKAAVPEGFFGGTNEPNDNTPLGWANAMTYLAIKLYGGE